MEWRRPGQSPHALVMAMLLALDAVDVASGRMSTFEEQRRIPWAPRVISQGEVAVLVKVDDRCRVEASISFQVFNFKLQQDGDVLYRYEDGSLLQEGQLGRGSILCGVEGHTPYGKPVFECTLNIAWRADLLLTPSIDEGHPEERKSKSSSIPVNGVVESIMNELPAGRSRMAAKLVASKTPRLFAQAAWASSIGIRGPPSAVLSDTANFAQCRGPLSDEECAEDRWEINLNKGISEEEQVEGRARMQENATQDDWIAMDVGSESIVVSLMLDWGPTYANKYNIQVSQDAELWTTVWTEENGPSHRRDSSSMHTVHFIDLRKSSSQSSAVIRPGVPARFVRLLLQNGNTTVSLWRMVALGTRHDGRVQPHTGTHRLQLYLTDKGGNELGVRSKLIKLIIIDSRHMCPFVYLIYGDRYKPFNLPNEHGHQATESRCIIHLTTHEQNDGALFSANASVAVARNLLFQSVQEKNINFLYIVFVDSDAVLEEVADYGFSSGAGAWATLERYLVRWLPAVGFPHHAEAHWDDSLQVQLVYNIFIVAVGVTAYHREAVAALLPYVTLLEHQSPWQAGVVHNAVASALYNAHRLQFNALHVSRASGSSREAVASARERHTEALAWLAPALLTVQAVMHVSWTEALASEPPGGGEAAVKNGTYLLRPPTYAVQGWSGGGLPWLLDHCHAYFDFKHCAVSAASIYRCPRSPHTTRMREADMTRRTVGARRQEAYGQSSSRPREGEDAEIKPGEEEGIDDEQEHHHGGGEEHETARTPHHSREGIWRKSERACQCGEGCSGDFEGCSSMLVSRMMGLIQVRGGMSVWKSA